MSKGILKKSNKENHQIRVAAVLSFCIHLQEDTHTMFLILTTFTDLRSKCSWNRKSLDQWTLQKRWGLERQRYKMRQYHLYLMCNIQYIVFMIGYVMTITCFQVVSEVNVRSHGMSPLKMNPGQPGLMIWRWLGKLRQGICTFRNMKLDDQT